MTAEKPIYIEKQYLGREWVPVTIRLVLAMSCFAVYTFTDERENSGGLLAIVGLSIITISIVMGFLLHFRTRVVNKSILLDGLWTTRLVKIDLNTIVKAEKADYSRYFFNNPVYNLHKKGAIRFYTSGNDAIYLTDKDGLLYVIGSQHANEFLRAVQNEMKKA